MNKCREIMNKFAIFWQLCAWLCGAYFVTLFIISRFVTL